MDLSQIFGRALPTNMLEIRFKTFWQFFLFLQCSFLVFFIKTSLRFGLSKMQRFFIARLMASALSRRILICWFSTGFGACFGNWCNQNKVLGVLEVLLSKSISRFFIKTNIRFWLGNLQIIFAPFPMIKNESKQSWHVSLVIFNLWNVPPNWIPWMEIPLFCNVVWWEAI